MSWDRAAKRRRAATPSQVAARVTSKDDGARRSPRSSYSTFAVGFQSVRLMVTWFGFTTFSMSFVRRS